MRQYKTCLAALAAGILAAGTLQANTFEQALSNAYLDSGIIAGAAAFRSRPLDLPPMEQDDDVQLMRGGHRGGHNGGNRGGFNGGHRGGHNGGNHGGFNGGHRGGNGGGHRPGYRGPRLPPIIIAPIIRVPGHRRHHRDWNGWQGHRGWGGHYGRWRWVDDRPHWMGWLILRGIQREACIQNYNQLEQSCENTCSQEHLSCVQSCNAYAYGDSSCVAQCSANDSYGRFNCRQDRDAHVNAYCR